ncbi:unnamed protein product [Porites evermanni]|uniref:Uncharacterized protein n=1 Tax=Porites evermanni TaxID=104178 RepID=A0ABN8LBM2_9CNID|nr:unnamed protein product [Porites evermanni]
MKRKAEDLLLAEPKSRSGKNALKFIMDVVEEKTDVDVSFKREVKRKYGFAGKEDFDIFGRNKLFAPRIKWEALKVIAENVKNSAKEYEVAFNGIKASIENKGDITQLAKKMSSLAEKQIESEKKRLVEAKNIAESEKRLYVKASLMVICEVISCINSNRSRYRVLLNLLRKTGRFGLNPILVVQPSRVRFYRSCDRKSHIALIIFSYGPHSNMHGGKHIVPLGGGVMAFLFWSGKGSKTGRKRPKKLLHSHFLQTRSFHLQVIIMHASQVSNRHSFGLPLIRMNGIHRKQFDHSHLDLL